MNDYDGTFKRVALKNPSPYKRLCSNWDCLGEFGKIGDSEVELADPVQ